MVGFALLVGVSTAQAQTQQDNAAPAAPQAAAAQAPAADPLKFTTDVGAIFFSVNPEKTADFEAGYQGMFTALAASAKPGMKELGASMHLHKLVAPPQAGQPVIYVLWISPVSKEFSYVYGKILFYSGKEPGDKYDGIFEKQEDATAVYNKLKDSIVNINPFPLSKIGG
jgi:hypothetical protein